MGQKMRQKHCFLIYSLIRKRGEPVVKTRVYTTEWEINILILMTGIYRSCLVREKGRHMDGI